jgi:hypothetical protein
MQAGIQAFQDACLKDQDFEKLKRLISDEKFAKNDIVFQDKRRTEAALFLVLEGSVQLSGGRNEVIKPNGGYFGEDQLLLDAHTSGTADVSSPTNVRGKYTATA